MPVIACGQSRSETREAAPPVPEENSCVRVWLGRGPAGPCAAPHLHHRSGPSLGYV